MGGRIGGSNLTLKLRDSRKGKSIASRIKNMKPEQKEHMKSYIDQMLKKIDSECQSVMNDDCSEVTSSDDTLTNISASILVDESVYSFDDVDHCAASASQNDDQIDDVNINDESNESEDDDTDNEVVVSNEDYVDVGDSGVVRLTRYP